MRSFSLEIRSFPFGDGKLLVWEKEITRRMTGSFRYELTLSILDKGQAIQYPHEHIPGRKAALNSIQFWVFPILSHQITMDLCTFCKRYPLQLYVLNHLNYEITHTVTNHFSRQHCAVGL